MTLFHSERIPETQVQKPKTPTTKPTPIGGAVAAATSFVAALYGFFVVTVALALAVLIVPFTTSSKSSPESSPTNNDSPPLGSFALIHRNFEQILRRLDSFHTALFERKKTSRNFGVSDKLASKNNFSEHTSATELCSETEFSESFSEDVWPDDIPPFTSMYHHQHNSQNEEEQLRRRQRDSAITKQQQQQQKKKNRDRLSVSGHMKKKTKDRLSIKDRLSSLSLHSSNHNKKNRFSSIRPLPKVQRSRTDPTLSTRSKMTSRSDFRSDFFLVDASKRSSRDEPLKPYQEWD